MQLKLNTKEETTVILETSDQSLPEGMDDYMFSLVYEVPQCDLERAILRDIIIHLSTIGGYHLPRNTEVGMYIITISSFPQRKRDTRLKLFYFLKLHMEY